MGYDKKIKDGFLVDETYAPNTVYSAEEFVPTSNNMETVEFILDAMRENAAINIKSQKLTDFINRKNNKEYSPTGLYKDTKKDYKDYDRGTAFDMIAERITSNWFSGDDYSDWREDLFLSGIDEISDAEEKYLPDEWGFDMGDEFEY